MISYNGNRQLQIYLSSGEILELSEDELIELHAMSELYFFENSELLEEKYTYKEKRPYNKNDSIQTLFKKYKSKDKTKSTVFRKIAKELNISYKAVEKAYYAK